MKSFTVDQLDVIRDLAECYWETNQRRNYERLCNDKNYLADVRENYVRDITNGLTDPEYW